MPRWQKSKPLNWSGLPVSKTSFNIMPIRDVAFSPELQIGLIYNHADKTRKLGLISDVAGNSQSNVGDGKVGKGAAFGMPGGGVNLEYLEKSEGAAIREGTNESGVRIIRAREIPIPGKKNKLLVSDKRTGKLLRTIFYADGQQEKVELRPNEMALLNPMNYYLSTVDWENSKPREFLLEYRDELISDGYCTAEEIARLGIGINSLTQEELLALGVNEEEVVEIGGFALLPLSRLRSMLETKWFFLDPDEDPGEYYRNDRVGPTSYVYRSHVERILQGLEIMDVTS